MRGKKYLWTLAAVYMTYLTHGIQAIILSQNLDQFAAQWSTNAAGVYSIIAYTGLAKFVSVWICGELSDKIGRRLMHAIGAVMYVFCFVGLLLTTSYAFAGVCAFLAGLATSFFDGSCYPAAQESWPKAPGSSVILIKGFISVSGLVYPLLVVSLRAAGAWKVGVIIPIVMSVIVLILTLVAPYSYDKELKAKKAAKKAGELVEDTKSDKLDEDAQRAAARFIVQPPKFVVVGTALYGFIAMATMYSAQQLLTRYGLTVV
ncbi:MAG: MFS transporter, partial [Clostridia bacterium]|nr:MFS transporter [Clostridia bacterium]